MSDRFQRTEMLLGPEAMHRLGKARVAVFGVGGVGGYVVEALARSGVGALDLIDKDVVDETNINRQLLALTSTIGRPKVEVAAERVKDISPDCVVTAYQTFFLPDTKEQFDFSQYDYVVDAIDTVTGKLLLIQCANEAGVPSCSSSARTRRACLSSPPWERATSSTRRSSWSATCSRHSSTGSRASCAKSAESGASTR